MTPYVYNYEIFRVGSISHLWRLKRVSMSILYKKNENQSCNSNEPSEQSLKLLDGRQVSKVHKEHLAREVDAFVSKHSQRPGLGVILVGDDPASQVYVKNKLRTGNDLGFLTQAKYLEHKSSQEELVAAIEQFNQDSAIHGFLVQLPLPQHMDVKYLLSQIDPLKDVDALTPENAGLFFQGQARINPCTPSGVMSILEYYECPIEGMNCVVVGRSEIVGKPMAQLLLSKNATVTICHSKTQNLRHHLLQADLVVVAAGKPEFIGREDLRRGAWVIDVGIHRGSDGRLVGDCRFSELQDWAGALTPVPGGVGPMTITSLMENALQLAKIQKGALDGG